jgi:hypothetical protein
MHLAHGWAGSADLNLSRFSFAMVASLDFLSLAAKGTLHWSSGPPVRSTRVKVRNRRGLVEGISYEKGFRMLDATRGCARPTARRVKDATDKSECGYRCKCRVLYITLAALGIRAAVN